MSAATALSMTAWTPARKGVAGLFIAIVFCGLACAAVYLSAVIFLLLNKVHPRHAEFLSIATYWDAYADDAKRRRQLIGSVGASGIALLVVLPFSLVVAARRQRPLHGDARFATEAEIVRAGLLDRDGEERSPRIIVGRHRGRFLTLPGQLSVMLSAPTRSGKGVGVVVPNLLNWPDSVVVLDIKGENYEITSGYRAAHGQCVYAFSPFDEQARSHRWNPLTAVRTSPLHRVGDLLAIGQVFFPNDGSNTSSEAFFNDQARNLFMGLGLYLLETPALPRTLGEMLRQSSGKGQSLKDHLSGAIGQRIKDGNPLSDECADALNRLLTNSENTLSSIVSTFNAPLTIFADAIVDAATSADDFRLEDLRRKRMTIYVRVATEPACQCTTSPKLVLLATGEPEHAAVARAGPEPPLSVPADQRRVRGNGSSRRDLHVGRLPRRLQPAAPYRGAGHVATRRALWRQGSPDVCDEPRVADPVCAARATRRR